MKKCVCSIYLAWHALGQQVDFIPKRLSPHLYVSWADTEMAILHHFSSIAIQHCSCDFTQQFHWEFSRCQLSWGCRCVYKFHAWEHDLLGKCPPFGSGVFCWSISVILQNIIWLRQTRVLFLIYCLVWLHSWQCWQWNNNLLFLYWLPLEWWRITWGMRAHHPLWCCGLLMNPLWWRSIISNLFVSHCCLIENCIQLF